MLVGAKGAPIGTPSWVVKELVKFIPKKRMGNYQELLNALDFLINKDNTYMTGQNLIIDGGRTIV